MDIKELRDEISRIDEQMAELFIKRMQIVEKVAEYKAERGLPIEDKEHEQRIIDSKSELVENQDLKPYYVQFIQNNMDVSKRWQHRIIDGQRIAYIGDEQDDLDAVKQLFPDGTAVAFDSYEEAYNAVADSNCDIAVLPFERSYAGDVGPVIDLIFSGNLHVNDIYNHRGENGMTRYAVISQAENKPETGNEIGSFLLMFTVKDEVGGLAKAINTISAYNFNMRIMRSRPMQDLPWHYYFYAEAAGDDSSESGRRMIKALSAVCPMVKIAGRYK